MRATSACALPFKSTFKSTNLLNRNNFPNHNPNPLPSLRYYRAGALLPVFTTPGIHFKIPILTSVHEVQTTVQTDMVRAEIKRGRVWWCWGCLLRVELI